MYTRILKKFAPCLILRVNLSSENVLFMLLAATSTFSKFQSFKVSLILFFLNYALNLYFCKVPLLTDRPVISF